MSRRFDPPHHLRALIARVRPHAAAHAAQSYIVGGTVRDVLLGRDVRDLDLAVDGDAAALARAIADALGGHYVRLDDERDVARVVLDGSGVRVVDVAAMRGSLEEDLRLRDFTVDALAAPLAGGAIVDVTGGLSDLDARVVRMVSPRAFDDDPLRLLRSARIAAELRFEIEPATAAAVRGRAARLAESAPERQRDELAHIFALDDAFGALLLLERGGLLDVIFPELAAGRGVTQPGEFHAYDVFEHNVRTVEALDVMLSPASGGARPWVHSTLWETFAWYAADLRAYLDGEMSEGRTRRSLLKIAGLLHDVAKPQTRELQPGGRVRFFGHADIGATIAAGIMRRLRFSAGECRFAETLVAEHLRPVQLAQVGEPPTLRALYRFARDAGEGLPAVLLLALADAASARGPAMTSEGWARHVAYMNSVLVRSFGERDMMHPPRILTGRDIMGRFGVPEGPLVGRLLEAVREALATGEVTDIAGAEALVRELLARERNAIRPASRNNAAS